jgi:hypothetical protein
MQNTSLEEWIAGTHADMVQAGHWQEAELSSPPNDTWQLALLGDLVTAVAALCDTQRKTGALDAARLSAVEDRLATLAQAAHQGAIAPLARCGIAGTREPAAVVPASGLTAHLLRQYLHLAIEVGEAIDALRTAGYLPSPPSDAETADIALVLFDLLGVLPQSVTAIARNKAKNRRRGVRYGRAAAEEDTQCHND